MCSQGNFGTKVLGFSLPTEEESQAHEAAAGQDISGRTLKTSIWPPFGRRPGCEEQSKHCKPQEKHATLFQCLPK